MREPSPDPTETVDQIIDHARWLFDRIHHEKRGTEKHAGQCVIIRETLKAARERRDVAQAIRCAYLLGVLAGEVLGGADPTFVRLVTENAQAGNKSHVGGREGHTTAHGDDEEKRQRWKDQFDAYQRHLASGCGKTAAMSRAGKEMGVSVKTIQRARKEFE